MVGELKIGIDQDRSCWTSKQWDRGNYVSTTRITPIDLDFFNMGAPRSEKSTWQEYHAKPVNLASRWQLILISDYSNYLLGLKMFIKRSNMPLKGCPVHNLSFIFRTIVCRCSLWSKLYFSIAWNLHNKFLNLNGIQCILQCPYLHVDVNHYNLLSGRINFSTNFSGHFIFLMLLNSDFLF